MEENKRKTNREKCETNNSYKKKYQFFGKARTNSTDSYFIEQLVAHTDKKHGKTNALTKRQQQAFKKGRKVRKTTNPFQLKTLNVVIKDLRRENLSVLLKKNCVKLGSATSKLLKAKQTASVVESSRNLINNISTSLKLLKNKSNLVTKFTPIPAPLVNRIKIKKRTVEPPKVVEPPASVNKYSKELKLLLGTPYPFKNFDETRSRLQKRVPEKVPGGPSAPKPLVKKVPPGLSQKQLKLDQKLFKKYRCKSIKLHLERIDKVLKMASTQQSTILPSNEPPAKPENKSDKYKLKIKMKSASQKKAEARERSKAAKINEEPVDSLANRLKSGSPEDTPLSERLTTKGVPAKPNHLSYTKSQILQDSLGLLKPLRVEEAQSLLVPLKSVKVKPPSTSSKSRTSLTNPKKQVKLDYKAKKQRDQKNMRRRMRNAAINLLQSPEELTPKKPEAKKKESKSKKDPYWSPFEYVEVKSMKAAPTFIEEVLPLPIPQVIPIAIPTEIPPLMESNVIIESTPNIMVEVPPLEDIMQTIATPKIPQANAKRKIKYPTNRDIKRVRFCDTITVLSKLNSKKKRRSKAKNNVVASVAAVTNLGDTGGEIQIQSVWGNADTVEQPDVDEPGLVDEDVPLSSRVEETVEEEGAQPERRLRNAKKINYSDDNSAFIDEILEAQFVEEPSVIHQDTTYLEKTAISEEEPPILENLEVMPKVAEELPEKEKIVESVEEPKDKVVQDCAVSSSSSNDQNVANIEPIPKLKLKLSTKKKKSTSTEKKEKKSKKKDKDKEKKSEKKVSSKDDPKPLPKLKIANINKNGETKLVIKAVPPQSDKKSAKPKTKAELKVDATKTIKRGPKPKSLDSKPMVPNKFDKLLNSPTKPTPVAPKKTFDSLLTEKKDKQPLPPPKPKTPPPPPKPKEPKIVNAETIAEFFAANIKKLSELNKNCNWGGIYEQAAYHFFDTTLTYYRHYLFNYWKTNSDGIQTILVPKLRPDQLDLNINVDNLFDAVAPEEETPSYNRGNRVEKIAKPYVKATPPIKTENTAAPLTSPCAFAANSNPPAASIIDAKKPGDEENVNSPKITFQNSPLNLSDSKQVEKDANAASVLQVPEINKYSTLTNFYNNAPSMLAASDTLVRPEDTPKDSNIVVPQYVKSVPQMTTMPLPKSSPYEMKNTPTQQQTAEGLKFVVTNVEHIQKDARQNYTTPYGNNLQKVEPPKPTYPSYGKQMDNNLQRTSTTPKPASATYPTYAKPMETVPKYDNQRVETTKPNYASYSKSIESTIQKYDTQKIDNTKPSYSTPYATPIEHKKPAEVTKNLYGASLDTPRPDRAKSIDVYADRNIPSPFLAKPTTPAVATHNLPRPPTENHNYFPQTNSTEADQRRSTNDSLNRLNYFNYPTNQMPLESKLAKSFQASQLESVKKTNFYYDMSKTYSPLQCVSRSETPDNRQSPAVQKPPEKEVKDERSIPSAHSIQSPPPQKLNTTAAQQDYSVLPLTSSSAATERPSLMSLDFQQSYLLNNYYNASYSLQRSLESGFLGTTSNLLLPSSVASGNEVNNLFPTDEVNQQYQQSQTNQLYSNVDNYMINSSDTQSTILLPNEAMIASDTNASYAMSENYSPTLLTLNAASTTDYHHTDSSNSYANWDKTKAWETKEPQKTSTPAPASTSSSAVEQQKPKDKPKYRPLQGRYDETAKNVLTLHLDHSRLFNAECKFAKNYSTYLKEQIRSKYPYCHPLIGNTRLNKLGSAKVYVHCMDKDCLRFNCTLQSNVVDAVGLTPVEIKVYGELNQDKQKQLCRMVQMDTERLLVE